jgi:parvulin-like peptidyl-prolyl isomerase
VALVNGPAHAQQPSSQTASASSSSAAPVSVSNAVDPGQRVILKVGSLQVTQADFESMVRLLEAQQGPADLSRQAIGDNYAQLLMLSQGAVTNHLDTSPDVVQPLALDRTQILSNAEFARLRVQAKPTPEEISQYYSAHLEDYDTVQLGRLFIWSSESSKDSRGLSPLAAKELADKARRAYASGGDVSKLVDNTPHDPENVMLDKEPLTFQRGELPPSLEKAAFALKEGGWTELNDAPGTYVFLQVVARSRRDLKAVSPQIEKKLQAQKLRQELEDVKKNAGIWMDEEYFASPSQKPVASAQPKSSAQEKQ